jgi:hypothetical protein
MQRVAWVVVLCACTRAPSIGPTMSTVARPAVSWPKTTPECVVSDAWESMCAPAFDIHANGAVVARVERTTYAHAFWSHLPLLGGERRAFVAAGAGGLWINGTASLVEQEFMVTRSIEIAGKHLRIPAGSLVSIAGTTGANVVVEARTRFAAPKTIEAAIPCDALGRAPIEAAPTGPPYARPKANQIALRASAKGPALFTFTPDPTDAWVWLGEEGDYVHVAGGHFAWRKIADRTSLVFDGWVDRSEVTRASAIDRDWDTGCDPMDINDTCRDTYAARETTVRSAPNGAAIGLLMPGAHVIVTERRDGFAAIALPNKEIVPPKGSSFWVAEKDISNDCKLLSPDDGCPCP